MSVWVAGIGAAATIGGAALSAKSTADAQSSANAAGAMAAGQQNAGAWMNYLSSRGVNLSQVLAKYPEFQADFNRAKAAGDRRDFNSWAFAAIQNQPNHPIHQDLNNPSLGSGAANVNLPAWAVDAQGRPLEPSILQQLIGTNANASAQTAPIGAIANLQNIHAMLQASPQVRLEVENNMAGSEDQRSPEQWLVDHITQTESQTGGGTFTTLLRNHLAPPASAAGAPGAEGAAAAAALYPNVNPAISSLIPAATNTAAGIFNGDLLKELQGALDPVAQARVSEAAAQARRIQEQRNLSGALKDTELNNLGSVLDARTKGAGAIHEASLQGAAGVWGAENWAAQHEHDANVKKLADVLGVRLEAAQQIYNASVGGSGNVRDARTKGANDIYGAELLRADTYAQSSEQALKRVLAEQQAKRARQGFGGGSSGSNLERARLTADYVQRGAGARADAGVGLQTRLSDAGVGYASDVRGADVGRATTVGQSREADSQSKLQAAVALARSMGAANVKFETGKGAAGVAQASTVAGAQESDAIARLTAVVDDARRRMGYLTSDADIAAAKAQEANALDKLNTLIADQNRRTQSIGLPFSLAREDLNLRTAATDNQYAGIDALLRRLGSFNISQAGGPQTVTPNVQPVINNGQILGGALGGLGSAVGTYQNNTAIRDAIAKWGQPAAAPNTAYAPANTAVPIIGSGNYLTGASVFGGG